MATRCRVIAVGMRREVSVDRDAGVRRVGEAASEAAASRPKQVFRYLIVTIT
jgi:hypothetical protein